MCLTETHIAYYINKQANQSTAGFDILLISVIVTDNYTGVLVVTEKK